MERILLLNLVYTLSRFDFLKFKKRKHQNIIRDFPISLDRSAFEAPSAQTAPSSPPPFRAVLLLCTFFLDILVDTDVCSHVIYAILGAHKWIQRELFLYSITMSLLHRSSRVFSFIALVLFIFLWISISISVQIANVPRTTNRRRRYRGWYRLLRMFDIKSAYFIYDCSFDSFSPMDTSIGESAWTHTHTHYFHPIFMRSPVRL